MLQHEAHTAYLSTLLLAISSLMAVHTMCIWNLVWTPQFINNSVYAAIHVNAKSVSSLCCRKGFALSFDRVYHWLHFAFKQRLTLLVAAKLVLVRLLTVRGGAYTLRLVMLAA